MADIYSRVRDLIVSGAIAPGARLLESEIAARTGASRTPVREALQRLTQDGFAVTVGGGVKTQVAVSPCTLADLLELFALVGALEGLAGRGVAGLTPGEARALSADLRAKNRAFQRLAARRHRDFPRFFAAHDAFHDALVASCATPRLLRLIEAIRPQVKRYELLYATAVGPRFDASVREHRAIVTAVATRDADAVERAVRANWAHSADRVADAFRARSVVGLGDYRQRLSHDIRS